jgi:hypothetical protein
MTRIRIFLAGLVSVVALIAAACTGSGESSNGAAPLDASALDEPQVTPFDATVTVTSPDGQLRVEVGIDDFDRPRYRVVSAATGRDEIVVDDSSLGVETSAASFATARSVQAVGPAVTITDSFTLPHGKARQGTIEATTQLVAADDLGIEFWVADTAVAFRYRIEPGSHDGTDRVEWERTSFAIDPMATAWLQPNDAPTQYTPAYEQPRARAADAGSPRPSIDGWVFPALFQSGEHWVLLTEAHLGDGAAGSHFSAAVTEGEYLLDLPNRSEGNGIGDPRPELSAADGWTSPWRLLVISTDLGDIVESNHVRHLSPGPAADDTEFDWVEPGTSSWSWWSDSDSSRSAEAIEPFIDMASEFGWAYSLVDANWNVDEQQFGEERLQELAVYAAERDVELFVWYNSGGPNNAVTEAPRDRMTSAERRREEFAWLREIGIVGVKVDFFQSDKPVTIQQYRDILSDAADFELMVNFHGSTLPRGWEREFPNLMTMEAVRGGEFYKFFDPAFPRQAPRINTVLPFTRNVVGPMDYTPGVLGDQFARTTTNSHELALSVVFESPLLHLVEAPEVYVDQPSVVIDLLETVPAAWDETQFVEGFPESHVVIARRDGDTWWIGAISALDDPLTVPVLLDNLGVPPGSELHMVCDQLNDAGVVEGYRITVGDSRPERQLELAPNGGCLARIRPS